MINPCEQAGFHGGGRFGNNMVQENVGIWSQRVSTVTKKDQEGPLELD